MRAATLSLRRKRSREFELGNERGKEKASTGLDLCEEKSLLLKFELK